MTEKNRGNMKNYLSFGGGVNSVAMHLLMLGLGEDFESVFVHHGTDWPETYEYVAGFQWWLKANGHRPITILIPEVQGFNNLYDYSLHFRRPPSPWIRSCTDKFKIRPMNKYYQKPCFVMIGIDAGEAHRAKISVSKGVENRYPLIEHNIDREGCKEIIRRNGLTVPKKSGCYICPFQPAREWKKLRREKTGLYCKALTLEKAGLARRKEEGKTPLYINKNPLDMVVSENQIPLFGDEYLGR
ncbi:phosphoadenosine phosphosulfate reductase family protein [delta proteobacterium NaphS2]|nr:phosphoadenosine phosphosulfate reductase family protein [delta proteobacterium NaphS2]